LSALEGVSARALVLCAALVGPLVVGATATVNPRYTIIGAATVGLVVFMLYRLVYGLAAFTVLVSFEQMPFVGDRPISKALGAVLVFSWLIDIARRREMPLLHRDHPVLSGAATGLMVWALVSATWATNVGAVRASATRLLLVVVLLFVAYSAIRSLSDLRLIVWAFMAGTFATCTYGFVTSDYEAGRLIGGVHDPNFLAALAVAALTFAFFFLALRPTPRVRLVLLLFIATFAITIVQTQSRGGIVGLAAALVLSIALAGPLRAHAIATAFIVVSVGLAYITTVAAPEYRHRISAVSEAGTSGRSDEWRIAAAMARDHPLLGVGLGNFKVVEPDYADENINLQNVEFVIQDQLVAHSTYLEPLAELGAIGLALFLTVIAGCYASALRGLRVLGGSHRRSSEIVTRATIASASALLVSYAFLSAQYDKQLWLVLAMLASTGTVARSSALEPSIGARRSRTARGAASDAQLSVATR
jgi:O-antigen ligase